MRPGGRGSLTMTPVAASGPLLPTIRVKVIVSPTTGAASLTDLVRARSACCGTVTGSSRGPEATGLLFESPLYVATQCQVPVALGTKPTVVWYVPLPLTPVTVSVYAAGPTVGSTPGAYSRKVIVPVGSKPPVRSATSCSVPPSMTMVGLGVGVSVGLAGLTVNASSVTP